MSDRTPWWYSGEEEPTDAPGSTMDWGALLSGAARMVDWATTSVMAPHAEHEDPADHPQCVVCRTILLVGDPTSLLARVPSDVTESPTMVDPDAPVPPPRIQWIPIVEARQDAPA